MSQEKKRKQKPSLLSRVLAAETYEAKNVEEAVELAVKFKRDGRYDWFRGQTREWLLRPSIARIDGDDVHLSKAQRRLAIFRHWIRRTPGLEQLGDNEDVVLAIAQHYGIQTPLLDFTTDPGVAGFFAATDVTHDKSQRGCIYCLNTSDLKSFWTQMRRSSKAFRDVPDIDFITVAVPNLWRLEAQHGVFLYGPSNWDDFYVVDSIVFPQSGLPSYPSKDDVCPKRKSQLELLLDSFFMADAFSGWHERVRTVFPEAKFFHAKAPPNRVEPEFFVGGTLRAMPCWRTKALLAWQAITKEPLRETLLGEIGLRIDLRMEPDVLRKCVAFGVLRALEIDPTLRKKAVRWVLLPQKRLQEKLSRSLDWLWNGMRTLPYSNEDIAEAAGLCFALHRLGFSEADRESAEQIASELLGKSVRVEFGAWEGSFGRGFASMADLRDAVRDDIEKRMNARHRKHAQNIQPLLQMCSSPRRLFKFDRFVHVFGRQVIPTQVLRPEGEASFFSPARLEGFGLP